MVLGLRPLVYRVSIVTQGVHELKQAMPKVRLPRLLRCLNLSHAPVTSKHPLVLVGIFGNTDQLFMVNISFFSGGST